MTQGARLLLISQWFDPEPTPKGLSFARALAERGFSVEVLTGFPNYPSGSVYPDYRLHAYQREVFGDVVVHRAWLYPSHDRSSHRRMLNYLSFFCTSIAAGLLGVEPPDLVYAYDQPATVGWAAALLAGFYRAPLVLDVQDLWPDTVRSSGMLREGMASAALDIACRWGYRRADRIVALSRGMEELLRCRGVESSRIRVIHNWADETRINTSLDSAAVDATRRAIGGGFTILFAGQMGDAQGLDTAIDAAALTPSVKWVFLGGGTLRSDLERRAADRRLHNVMFIDPVPMDLVAPWLAAADVLLVSLKNDPLYSASIPGKTQAYLLAGRPILMAAAGDAATMINAAEAGITCPPSDARALAAAADSLAAMSQAELRRLGDNGCAYYERELRFAVGVNGFANVFRELLHAR